VQLARHADRDRLEAGVENASAALRVLAPLLVLWFGVHRVTDGSLSLGTLIALQALAMSVLVPLATLVASAQRLQSVRAHLERLRDVVDAEPERRGSTQRRPARISGRIEMNNVSFRYDRRAPRVLRDISLTIEPGSKVALVGPSGSGKSTMAMLLLGLYAPSAGEILYDGANILELDARCVRRRFGVVLQEPFLFGDSIRANIALGHPDLPAERLIRAARLAAIHDDIIAMPMGYETRVGEGGSALSGGQRQRLAIARALVADPVVVLFDEATSHLDSLIEQRIEENLRDLGCTRLVIAHRLSTVRDADEIIVLDNGVIVERGGHDALVARAGLYASLVACNVAPAAPVALAACAC
jgi:ABC-type bacteriocin/lantibiotic exporter with double-glycine peptidase domain